MLTFHNKHLETYIKNFRIAKTRFYYTFAIVLIFGLVLSAGLILNDIHLILLSAPSFILLIPILSMINKDVESRRYELGIIREIVFKIANEASFDHNYPGSDKYNIDNDRGVVTGC